MRLMIAVISVAIILIFITFGDFNLIMVFAVAVFNVVVVKIVTIVILPVFLKIGTKFVTVTDALFIWPFVL